MNTKLKSTLLIVLLSLSCIAAADTKTRVSSFEYTASGLLSKEILEPTSPQDCLQTSYSYDVRGNKVSAAASPCASAVAPSTTSAGTRTSSTIYNAIGQFPTASANALGHTESRVFDARFGLVTALTGPNQLTTNWQYDSFGRKTRETRTDGSYSTWTYQKCDYWSWYYFGLYQPQAQNPHIGCPNPAIAGNNVNYLITQSDFATNNVLLSPPQTSIHRLPRQSPTRPNPRLCRQHRRLRYRIQRTRPNQP